MTARWYVVQTKPGQEVRAWVAIAEQKLEDGSPRFETFFPQTEKTIRHARMVQRVKRSLYPGYIFVRFDVADQTYGIIFHTRGVHTILGCHRQVGIPATPAAMKAHAEHFTTPPPLPVPEGVVEWLRGYVQTLPPDHEDRPLPRLKRGEMVRIEDGPFEGWQGLVDADAKIRVRVLLDILGREMAILVPRKSLAPVA